jgi:hypothetical protein
MRYLLVLSVFFSSCILYSCTREWPYYVKNAKNKSKIFKFEDKKIQLEIRGIYYFSGVQKFSFFYYKLKNISSTYLKIQIDSVSLKSKNFEYNVDFEDSMEDTSLKNMSLSVIVRPQCEEEGVVAFKVDQVKTPYYEMYPPLDEEVILKMKIAKDSTETVEVETAFVLTKK